MGYSADSFTAGEQPTTAKWNKLWTNDASFNDGTGIGTNAIAAASLATNAITLGYAQITTTFTSSSTSIFDVTGLSVTVTIPAGSRNVKITAHFPYIIHSASGPTLDMVIDKGGTVLGMTSTNGVGAGARRASDVIAYDPAPSAGSVTYKVRANPNGAIGNFDIGAGTTTPAFILVEAI